MEPTQGFALQAPRVPVDDRLARDLPEGGQGDLPAIDPQGQHLGLVLPGRGPHAQDLDVDLPADVEGITHDSWSPSPAFIAWGRRHRRWTGPGPGNREHRPRPSRGDRGNGIWLSQTASSCCWA